MKNRSAFAVPAMTTALCMLVSANCTQAREPGAGGTLPPWGSIGAPVGMMPPPGFYGKHQIGYQSVHAYDANGNRLPAKVDSSHASATLIWVPDWEVLGARYQAFIVGALVDINLDLGSMGEYSKTGLSDIEIHPLDLGWELAPGISAGFGVSIFAPAGSYHQGDIVNVGRNFWSVSPSVGMTYARDGWMATFHAQYYREFENKATDYRSGDEFMINFTALKDVGGFSVGPVGYFRKQVGEDRNNGAFYGGATFGKTEEYGLGFGVQTQIGPANVQMFYTHDLKSVNTSGGDRVFTNIVYKF